MGSLQRKSKNVKELWEEAWSQHGIGKIPATEFRFHDVRKFRFDYAWPAQKVAVETDGYGYHQTKAGLQADHEKSNLAQECGWIVIRHTNRSLGSKQKRHDAAKQVLRILKRRRLECTQQSNGLLASDATCTNPAAT